MSRIEVKFVFIGEEIQGEIKEIIFKLFETKPWYWNDIWTKNVAVQFKKKKNLPGLPLEKPPGYLYTVLFWFKPLGRWIGFNLVSQYKRGWRGKEEETFEGPYFVSKEVPPTEDTKIPSLGKITPDIAKKVKNCYEETPVKKHKNQKR